MRFLRKLINHKLTFGTAVLLCSVMLTACSMGGGFNYDRDSAKDGEYKELFKVSKADANVEFGDDAVVIDLDECSKQALIDEPGDYIVSGKLYGSLVVDAEDGNVRILLKDADISASSGPALYVASAGKVILTLAEDSENVLSDSTNYDDYEGKKACIFSEADLTINGSGSLSVYSYVGDGIRTVETLKMVGGDIYVLAKKNAVRGNDGVLITPDRLQIECEGYGIVTITDSKGRSGHVQINGGDINITSGKQPVLSRGDLYISLPADVKIYSVLPGFEVDGELYVEEGAVE